MLSIKNLRQFKRFGAIKYPLKYSNLFSRSISKYLLRNTGKLNKTFNPSQLHCQILYQSNNILKMSDYNSVTDVKLYSTMEDIVTASNDFKINPPKNIQLTDNMDFDEAAFKVIVNFCGIKVNSKDIGQYRKKYRSMFSAVRRVNGILEVEGNDNMKIILLSPVIQSLNQLPKDIQEELTVKSIETVNIEKEFTYEYFSSDQILNSLIPLPDGDICRGFEAVGHIAHVNLREHMLPYRKLIGKVLLEKNKKILTVVNKLDKIDNTFRNFEFEILAGKKDYIAQVFENNCRLRFDYSKVYWNSKLETEHRRQIALLNPKTDVLCDMMSGVGPFAVPACKRGVVVYANDLNPHSYSAMVDNIRLNKLKKDRILAYNMDGRDFIKSLVGLIENDETKPMFTKVVMNLPAIAIEFLDCFRGAFKHMKRSVDMPLISCYCFHASDESHDVSIFCTYITNHNHNSNYNLNPIVMYSYIMQLILLSNTSL